MLDSGDFFNKIAKRTIKVFAIRDCFRFCKACYWDLCEEEAMEDDLEKEFTEQVRQYCDACAEFNYNPTAFRKMIDARGAVGAVRTLFSANRYSEGFVRLWEEGRLDLSMEALVLEHPRYLKFFTSSQLENAKKWLDAVKYEVDIKG